VQAGAGWKLSTQGANFYSTLATSVQVITSTNALLVQFKAIPGWNVPTNISASVSPGILATNMVNYTVASPVLTLDLVKGLGITGTTNTTYRIEQSTSPGVSPWVLLKTNTITGNGFNLLVSKPITNQTMFYRAVWLGR
jgi:hypothetical protein